MGNTKKIPDGRYCDCGGEWTDSSAGYFCLKCDRFIEPIETAAELSNLGKCQNRFIKRQSEQLDAFREADYFTQLRQLKNIVRQLANSCRDKESRYKMRPAPGKFYSVCTYQIGGNVHHKPENECDPFNCPKIAGKAKKEAGE